MIKRPHLKDRLDGNAPLDDAQEKRKQVSGLVKRNMAQHEK